MMKERSRTHRNGGGVAEFLVAGLFLVAALLFLFHFDALLRDFVLNLAAPANANPEYALLSRNALIARLSDADRELARIRYANVITDLLAGENQKLREAARVVAADNGLGAAVLARPPRTHYDSLVIGIGSASGIVSGDLVVANDVALGRVTSVGAKTSLVELFSNPGAERDVLIGTPQSVAIARGLGGGAFELTIPQEIAVAVGDIVRTPASASLALGIVTDISSKPTDTSKTVRFSAPVAADTLDFVEVIPNAQ